MNPEQFVAIIGALTALVGAVAGLVAAVYHNNTVVKEAVNQTKVTHELVNGKMTELVTLAQLAARKQGELEGRDYASGPGRGK